MEKTSKQDLSQKIENKLDAFFSDDDLASESQTPTVSLEKLKSTVLSIDWEITDKCLDDLTAETDALIEVFQSDRPTNALLRMLKALANYIRKHKAQAHQEAIKRVMSVYASVESIVEQYPLDDNRKREIVAAEIKAFHLLKNQIGLQRSTSAEARSQSDDTVATAAGKSLGPDAKDMKQVLSDFESKINTQIEQLKTQLDDIKTELTNYIKK